MQTYLINAKHYYDNSQETLQKKEFGKAGELLWGAIAETAKALHLINSDVPLSNHNNIRDFLGTLSTSYSKKELDEWKNSADNLHVNFYETYLDEHRFLKEYTNGEQLLAFLHSVVSKKKHKHSTT